MSPSPEESAVSAPTRRRESPMRFAAGAVYILANLNPSRGVRRSPPYLERFRKAVMMTAFVKSMKKAPTIGTTR